MRALTAAVLTGIFVLMISGCAYQKMMEPMESEMKPMDSDMSSMDTHIDKPMKTDTMMEGAATESIKPKM